MHKILVTGGAGFIGSHAVLALSQAGYVPVILDDFSNSENFVIERINSLTGKKIAHYDHDYRDIKALKKIIDKEQIVGIVHFAAYKAVGESVDKPLKYYSNNVSGFIDLLDTAINCGVNKFVFSSSAAVYGAPKVTEVSEDTECHPTSPYGWSKHFDEIILESTCQANPKVSGIALRYFNVIGAHPSGRLGELPKGIPQNLLPIILQAASGKIPPLTIYGDGYPTPDGTCLRDYVHVVDLAEAHVRALDLCFKSDGLYEVFNIGSGKPTSVMELITAFEKVNDVNVPYKIGKQRPGDPAAYYALNKKALKQLRWKAQFSINDSVRDAWKWQQTLNTT